MVATAGTAPAPDRAMLAARIQGFGNVNPPPLEEENAKTVAKRAVGRLGDMLGEEVALTVEDFREKGAVGAVKDAVADAGDILIDGVSGIFGWLRGDPPAEEDPSEAAEDAAKVLAHGPGGAAYGISQASPTGGINAVWVMPEDADPKMLQELHQQQVPKGVQPYAGPPGSAPMYPQQCAPAGLNIQPYQDPKTMVPGGPAIAPYAGPGARNQAPAFMPGAPGGYGGQAAPAPGFVPGMFPGAPGFGAPGANGFGGPAPGSVSSQGSGAKGLVERVAKGDMVMGADLVKRLMNQCAASRTSAQQLGDLVSERARRFYLGLDGGDPNDADAGLARLLALTAELSASDSRLAQDAAKVIVKSVNEEFLSLQSNAKHCKAAAPLLRKVGLVNKAPEMEDLLGESTSAPAGAASADLLGGPSPAAQSVDLLGGAASAPAAATTGDLLF